MKITALSEAVARCTVRHYPGWLRFFSDTVWSRFYAAAVPAHWLLSS